MRMDHAQFNLAGGNLVKFSLVWVLKSHFDKLILLCKRYICFHLINHIFRFFFFQQSYRWYFSMSSTPAISWLYIPWTEEWEWGACSLFEAFSLATFLAHPWTLCRLQSKCTISWLWILGKVHHEYVFFFFICLSNNSINCAVSVIWDLEWYCSVWQVCDFRKLSHTHLTLWR